MFTRSLASFAEGEFYSGQVMNAWGPRVFFSFCPLPMFFFSRWPLFEPQLRWQVDLPENPGMRGGMTHIVDQEDRVPKKTNGLLKGTAPTQLLLPAVGHSPLGHPKPKPPKKSQDMFKTKRLIQNSKTVIY